MVVLGIDINCAENYYNMTSRKYSDRENKKACLKRQSSMLITAKYMLDALSLHCIVQASHCCLLAYLTGGGDHKINFEDCTKIETYIFKIENRKSSRLRSFCSNIYPIYPFSLSEVAWNSQQA